MTRFNLSEWAVNNKAIVVFLMLLCAVAGVGAYEQLGRQEDPGFHRADHGGPGRLAGRDRARHPEAGHGPARKEARRDAQS